MSDNSDDDVKVSSTLYNLAGPETNRVDFLKSLIVGATQQQTSIAQALNKGYLTGPAIRYRSFLHWAENDPGFLATFGVTSGVFGPSPSVDFDVVQTQLMAELGLAPHTVSSIERADVGPGKISFWALRYAADTDPTLPVPKLNPPYSGDNTYSYDAGANEITVHRPGGVTEHYTPSSPAFDPALQYLYVKFTPCIPASEDAIVPGTLTTLADGDPDPSWAFWLRMPDSTAGVYTATLTATDALDSTYSDGRTPEHTDYTPISTPASEPTEYSHYIVNVYGGVDTDGAQYSIRTHKEFSVTWVVDTRVETTVTTVTLGGGVTQTNTFTRTTEYLRKVRQVQESTQKVIWKTLLPARWFIYQYGSGNDDLDDQMEDPTPGSAQAFYPPIPLRIDNKTVGPLQKVATRWLIHVGSLGFTWDADKYDMSVYFSGARDVQVSLHDGSEPEKPAHWVSVKWISSPGAGLHYVESRPVDSDATISTTTGRDDVDLDIEVDYPLYRVFSEATAGKPGFYRVRKQSTSPPSPYSNQWEVLSGPSPLLEKPSPDAYGYDSVNMPNTYAVAKRAFRKAYGTKFDETLKSVLDNDSIGEIDYAYAVFGVSLNVKENACRKYIYRFLEHMLGQAAGGPTEADDFMAQYLAAYESQSAWKSWWDTAHSDPSDRTIPYVDYSDSSDGVDAHAAAPPSEPVQVPYPVIPWKSLTVESVVGGVSGYKSQIHWAFIDRTRGTGVLGKPGSEGGGYAKPGELWWTVEDDPFPAITADPASEVPGAPKEYADLNNQVTLNWQVSATHWEQLTVTGMHHENHIYKKYMISYTAKESVNWTKRTHTVDGDGVPVETITGDYEESGFIFPLHGGVYREMSIVDATQMATACTFLVFNSYTVVQHPWYTSTWFRVIVIIVIVIIAVAAALNTGGASLGVAGSFLSAGATTATLSGSVILIIGALADILTGMALSYAATWIATKAFGEKVGSIVGILLGLALGTVYAGGLDALMKVFSTPDGLLAVGMALGNGVAKILQMQAQETMEATVQKMAKYSEKLAKIQELYNKEFGANRIDPNKVSQLLNELAEKPEVFLQRTLMTGSDIVNATLAQVDDFVEDRLRLVLP
jgi:hypothetical protein